MTDEERDEAIAAENRKKENCLQHLMYMCYESGVKVIDIFLSTAWMTPWMPSSSTMRAEARRKSP